MKFIGLKNRKFDVHTSPFCYFEIAEFFPPEIYKKLEKEWSSIKELSSRATTKSFTSSREDPKGFEGVLAQLQTWAWVTEYLRSSSFVSEIEDIVKPYIWEGHGDKSKNRWVPKSMGIGGNRFIRRLSLILFNSYPKLRDRYVSEVKVTCSFTSMRKGDEIFPHNDDGKKLFSALFYVPPKGWNSEYGGHTEYYKPKSPEKESKWKSIGATENHLNGELRKQFYEDMECFYRNEYVPNKLVGFAKNNLSWHAVPKIDCPDTMERRAFLINIRR